MSAGDASAGADSGGTDLGLSDAANVLVLAPSMDEDARRSYYETLVPDRPGTTDVLAIDYGRTPEQWLEEWRRYLGDRPRRCAIVSVGDETRSASATTVSAGGRDGPSDTITCVESPDDLTGLGIRTTDYLSGYGGPETVVTFDSVTALLQFVDLQRAFRFLHLLARQVTRVGAVAHYHMDPSAHDRRDVATLASLFDAVAEFDDGSWSVRRR